MTSKYVLNISDLYLNLLNLTDVYLEYWDLGVQNVSNEELWKNSQVAPVPFGNK